MGMMGDIKVVMDLYEDQWWLEQLAARELRAIWMRHWYPHNYEITAFEAFLDCLRGTISHLWRCRTVSCAPWGG